MRLTYQWKWSGFDPNRVDGIVRYAEGYAVTGQLLNAGDFARLQNVADDETAVYVPDLF